MDTIGCELGVTFDQKVSNQRNTIGCSICGTGGQLKRGWCEMHYQRWYRTGDPNKVRRRVVTQQGHVQFTVALWNRWLEQLNTAPDPVAVNNVESIRNSIESVVRSTWNRRDYGRGGG